jgi:hypothetical protein
MSSACAWSPSVRTSKEDEETAEIGDESAAWLPIEVIGFEAMEARFRNSSSSGASRPEADSINGCKEGKGTKDVDT